MSTFIYTSSNGYPWEVTYTYHPASRGHRDKYGAPEEPDEPAYVEIESVHDVAHALALTLGDSIDEEEFARLEDAAMADCADRHSDPGPEPEPPFDE